MATTSNSDQKSAAGTGTSDVGSQARGPAENQDHTYSIERVRSDEVQRIRERRAVVAKDEQQKNPALHDMDPLQDLVGLALSGGGIRAASVGLGVLQALQQENHLREIDYLSTVSGGGYIGGYLSSAAVISQEKVKEALATGGELLASHHGATHDVDYGQPSLVQRFIFGGKYLLRPWVQDSRCLLAGVLRFWRFYAARARMCSMSLIIF